MSGKRASARGLILAMLLAAGLRAGAEEIILRECLVLRPVGRSGRAAAHTDAVEAQIVAGKWTAPKAGDAVALPDGGTQAWTAAQANADGWIENAALRGGYAYASVISDAGKVMVLEAAGHNMAYVNGEPRAGDPYGYGATRLPVLLKPGRNDLLFAVGRGRLQAKLVAPKAPALLNAGDLTLPDYVQGEREAHWAAVVVVNATSEPLRNLVLRIARADGAATTTSLPALLPLGTRKVGFRLPPRAPATPGAIKAALTLLRKRNGRTETLDTAEIALRTRRPTETHKRAFLSGIDGSVQYYAVNPAPPEKKAAEKNGPLPALFLSLHGASVEAIGQADAYAPKSWGHLVAPTNRRPYGFDWEDWGRQDALEVLELAQKRLKTDPQRVYLTGHSMGGHGTWHLGVTFPDRFAAIAPSAGWISFQSYAGGARYERPTPVEALLQRASASSDTLALVKNTAPLGVYILHGDADDNVPVTEARAMGAQLAAFHRDFRSFEQPGAGHWWDASDEPGADCVDWLPLFDFFARRRIPANEAARQIEFATMNPAVSSQYRWAEIGAQEKPMQRSSVSLRCDPGQRRFVGATENVARLALDVAHLRPGEPVTVELDGQKLDGLPWPAGKPRLWLNREGGRWKLAAEPSPAGKGPHRSGPFKRAFRHRMMFVYGTRGTAEENAWAFAKARFDAEQFWYRGNGAIDVLADTEFDAAKERDRSVILYGNRDTNAAWNALLADSPVQVTRQGVQVGERAEAGGDLACLFLRPRPGSDVATVAAVSGTGLAGMRLTDRLPYFVSGFDYPDCTIIGPEMLATGSKGIRCAGFFGNDWSVASGEFAWNAARK